jgi:PAS domain S-box-containing protein
MEELQATQEEASRQTERLIVLEETINQSLIRAEFDAEGKLLYTNQLFTELFEYGRDTSIQGKNILDLLHVDEREHFKGVWKKLVKNNESFSGSIRHITRSGKDLFTMSSFHVMKNEDSSFAKVVMLAIDTTKEKFQVQKNEIIVDAISRNSIHLELDINGNILYGNSAFLQLFGLKKTDFKSLVVFDLVSPLELEAFNKHWEGIIKGSGYSGIVRGRLADDEEVWIRGSFNAVYNMAHEIERIVFMGQDMTKERNLESEVKTLHDTIKKQEKMLHEAEKNLIARLRETKNELMDQFKETERLKNLHEKILEDTPDAIITTSHDNRIVSFNKAAEQLWGIDRKEVLDHDVSILFPEKLAEKDELISSFIRPGENKITGRRKKCIIMDKKGREKSVMMMLTKAKVDHENAYMAFIQRPD